MTPATVVLWTGGESGSPLESGFGKREKKIALFEFNYIPLIY